MVRPLKPIIEYYINYDYIVNVLCENKDKPKLKCNGKCYLNKQVKEANNTKNEQKSTVPKINLDDYPISTLNQFVFCVNEVTLNNSKQLFIIKDSSQDFINTIFKPPRILS